MLQASALRKAFGALTGGALAGEKPQIPQQGKQGSGTPKPCNRINT